MKNYFKYLIVRVVPVLFIGLLATLSSNAQCPIISELEIPRGCESAPFDSLFVVSTADSIEIVAFPFGTGIDPYTTSGGTSLGLQEMPANDSLLVQPYAHTLGAGFYLFYAIVHPTPADPACRPSDVKSVEIFQYIDLVTSDGTSCPNGRVNFNDYVSGVTNANYVAFFDTAADAMNETNEIQEYDYPSAPRYYYVIAKATNSALIPDNCVSLDSFYIDILSNPTANAGADQTICEGENAQLSASGGTTYAWAPATLLTDATIGNPETNISTTTEFAVTVTDANGCSDIDQVIINVTQLPVCPPISGSQN